MTEIQIADPNISGYAFYEQGILARAVLINTNAYLGGARLRAHIRFDIPGASSTMMIVKRLAIR